MLSQPKNQQLLTQVNSNSIELFQIYQLLEFLPLQQRLENILVIQPKSPWGPIIAQAVVKKPAAQMKEKPSVDTMKIPNCWKKMILAPRRKHEEVTVVRAPEVTEIPTCIVYTK